jgi:hypothetical protein
MNTVTTTALSDWERDRLAVLLDALDGIQITDAERASWRGWPGSRWPPWRTSPP